MAIKDIPGKWKWVWQHFGGADFELHEAGFYRESPAKQTWKNDHRWIKMGFAALRILQGRKTRRPFNNSCPGRSCRLSEVEVPIWACFAHKPIWIGRALLAFPHKKHCLKRLACRWKHWCWQNHFHSKSFRL